MDFQATKFRIHKVIGNREEYYIYLDDDAYHGRIVYGPEEKRYVFILLPNLQNISPKIADDLFLMMGIMTATREYYKEVEQYLNEAQQYLESQSILNVKNWGKK